MYFIAAQILGIITTAAALISVQFKNIKYILISQLVTNLLVAATYALLGGLSGAWICFAATGQCLIMFFLKKTCKSGQKTKRLFLAFLFIFIYVAGTACVYKDWNDIISGICAVLFALAIVQEESKGFRVFMLINAGLWIVYDFNTAAYTNIITHGLEVGSISLAMLRLDRGVNKRETIL